MGELSMLPRERPKLRQMLMLSMESMDMLDTHMPAPMVPTLDMLDTHMPMVPTLLELSMLPRERLKLRPMLMLSMDMLDTHMLMVLTHTTTDMLDTHMPMLHMLLPQLPP